MSAFREGGYPVRLLAGAGVGNGYFVHSGRWYFAAIIIVVLAVAVAAAARVAVAVAVVVVVTHLEKLNTPDTMDTGRWSESKRNEWCDSVCTEEQGKRTRHDHSASAGTVFHARIARTVFSFHLDVHRLPRLVVRTGFGGLQQARSSARVTLCSALHSAQVPSMLDDRRRPSSKSPFRR